LKKDHPVLGKYTFRLNLKSEGESTNSIHGKIQKTSMKVEVTNVDTKEVTIYSSIGGCC
jgi:translation initiation factor IF-1